MLKNLLNKIIDGDNLTELEINECLTEIMEGDVSGSVIGSFLTALKIKGESIEEITGGARTLRHKCTPINLDNLYTLDTCGTGGDNSGSFNISTAVAFVAASAGIAVVKHGNRSITSKSGSADVLEALEANINLSPQQVQACVAKHNIGFLFAPKYHSTMKYVATIRKELGFRTIFNLLGPLSNPAFPQAQILGVYDERLTEPMAHVLKNLGTKRALVVHGMDGIDEITTTTDTKISELKDNKIFTYYFDPRQYGFKLSKSSDLVGGSPQHNADIIKSLFHGERGPKSDILIINSAAALYIGNKVDTMDEGIALAKSLLEGGFANKKLNDYILETRKYV